MTSPWALLLVLVASVAAFRLGNRLARRLPVDHLSLQARQAAQTGIGMLATLLALVLGLMITSAKHSFDDRQAELLRIASSVVLLDRALVGFGDGAQDCRAQLRQIFASVRARIDDHRHDAAHPGVLMSNLHALTKLQHSLLGLSARDETQKWYQARAMQLSSEIAHDRVLIVERNQSSIPTVLLAVVVAWVVLIYLGLGIFHVSNPTVNITLDICALAFACAIAIVIELDTPYSGLVGVSTEPLARAAAALEG